MCCYVSACVAPRPHSVCVPLVVQVRRGRVCVRAGDERADDDKSIGNLADVYDDRTFEIVIFALRRGSRASLPRVLHPARFDSPRVVCVFVCAGDTGAERWRRAKSPEVCDRVRSFVLCVCWSDDQTSFPD